MDSDSDAKAASRPTSGFKTLKLMLPFEVKIVESYITWLEELAEHVEASAISKADSLESYIRLILNDEKECQINEDGKTTCGEMGEDEDSDWNDNVGFVAMKMNVAAMYTYLGDYPSAETHINTLHGEQLKRLNLTDKHKQVIEYCRDSLVWAIGVLKGLEREESGDKYTFVIKGSSKLNCLWEELSEDGDNQVKATLGFLKACLSAALKVSEDTTLKFIMEAIKLDPECNIWYHHAYRIMRRIRRNVRRSATSRLFRPSEEEERLARTAYDLCSNDVVAITDYALVLKESLWTAGIAEWEKQEAKYMKCTELFEKALTLAIGSKNKKWTRKIKIYLAEFLVFGKGSKLDKNVGKQMFDESALEYPNSTFVLHKVGKLYHHGIGKYGGGNDNKKFVDLELAKDYYQRAIDSNSGNFACLMDYLKLLQRLEDYTGMLVAVEKALKRMKRDYQVSKLLTLKGYIVWIYNPNRLPDRKSASLESWMFVLKNFPEFTKEVYCSMELLRFDSDHPAHEVRTEIIKYLEMVKIDESQDEDKDELLNMFIEGLKKSIARDKRPKLDWSKVRNPQRNGNEGDLSERMRGLNVTTRNNSHRMANKDGASTEWRKKSEGQRRYASGEENRLPGSHDHARSEADKDSSWRKK